MLKKHYKMSARLILNFILGFAITWPLYFDINSWSLIIHGLDEKLWFGNRDEVPVPIGFITILIIAFIGVKKKYALHIIRKLPFAGLFTYLLMDIGIFAYLLGALYIVLTLVRDQATSLVYNFRGSVEGWLAGGLLQVLLYFFYNFPEMNFPEMDDTRGMVGNLFGIQIYSFWVSYSAAMSVFFICAFGVILGSKFKVFSPLLSYLLIYPVYTATRKAAFLDVFFGTISASLLLLKSKTKIRISMLVAVICMGTFTFLLYDLISENRDASISGAWFQRAEAYLIFLQSLVALDVESFLFGYGSGFGGYSNVILDIFVRAGIIGVLSCFVFLVFPLISILVKNWQSSNYIYRLIILYISLNFIVGNLANLNITQPYYIINLILAFLLIAKQTKETKVENSNIST